MILNEIFAKLLDTYSHQGWWPITGHDGTNPTKTGSTKGYHPCDYSFPRNLAEQFEIIVGAVLTQNTSWTQVETSINNLKQKTDLTPEKLLDFDEEFPVISISLNRDYRGLGLSKILLSKGLNLIEGKVIAYIKKENSRSISFFKSMGFKKDSEIIIKNCQAFKFIKE